MASTTTRLKLYKRDPVADANTNFNLKTMINDNLDLIDALVALKSETLTPTEIQAKIDAAISALVTGAPTTLDTLNELAAALGDDPNFATTVTNLIAGKISSTEKGKANGVATLGADGKVPASQLNVSSTANKITITDAGGYFASTETEGALQEIGQALAGSRGEIITQVNALLQA
jgi:hypothetical protein